MVDTLSPKERSKRMSLVRNKNSKAEMLVRRIVRDLGYGYRLHRRDIPGCPDLAFIGRKKAIFVHGCFWHRHEGCPNNRLPKSRVDFWHKKLEQNAFRDKQNQQKLTDLKWRYLIVWECEIKDKTSLKDKIHQFMEDEEHESN